MVNMYNRRQAYKQLTEPIMLGPVPAAALNRLAMLTDYIVPEERIVACPNQDVVYGAASLALDLSPVVIQYLIFLAAQALAQGLQHAQLVFETIHAHPTLLIRYYDGFAPAGRAASKSASPARLLARVRAVVAPKKAFLAS